MNTKATQQTQGLSENFECDSCGKVMINKEKLRKHKNYAHLNGLQSFQCSFCSKTFKRKQVLKVHIKLLHPTEAELANPRVCKKCGVSFLTEYKYKLHVKASGCDGSEVVSCELCFKQFKTIAHRRLHMERMHNKKAEESSICPVCGKGTKHLKTHMYVHSERDVWPCSACGDIFKSLKEMRKHYTQKHYVRKIGDYCCDICGKVFTQKTTLKTHLMIHSGVKKYKCDICHRSFTQPSALGTHQRIHTGHNPYKCKCGESFRWASTYNKHKTDCSSNSNDNSEAIKTEFA